MRSPRSAAATCRVQHAATGNGCEGGERLPDGGFRSANGGNADVDAGKPHAGKHAEKWVGLAIS